MRRNVIRDAAQAVASQKFSIEKPKNQLYRQSFKEDPVRLPSSQATPQWDTVAWSKKSLYSTSKTRPASREEQAPSKWKSRPTARPSPTINYRRFTWDQWNGKPWHTKALPAYRATRFWNFTTRASTKLHQYERLLAARPDHLVNQFWKLHFRAMLRAIHTEERLTLHLTDTVVISFLLRTAPTRITRRLASALQAFLLLSLEIQEAINSWHVSRIVIGHQSHNLLFFKASVDRLRMTAAIAAKGLTQRIEFKKDRMNVKTSVGPRPFHELDEEQWRNTQRMPIKRPKDDEEKFEAFLDAFPPRWIVEPLVSYMAISMHRLNRLSKLTNDVMATLEHQQVGRLRGHIRRVRRDALQTSDAGAHTAMDLRDLTREITALRYYRLQLFPGSYTEREVALGKSLWQQMHYMTAGSPSSTR